MLANITSSLTKFVPLRCCCRTISFDKISNKKITRLESDVELGDCEFNGRLINRNPRNLEQTFREHKPKGFWLEKSPQTNWNSIVLDHGGDHLDAYLQNWWGKKLVSASTREPQLTKYYRNPRTKQAAIIIAKVLSRRCLQSGYLCAGVDGSISADAPRSKAFLDTLVEEGLTLDEPQEIEPRSNSDI